ncbi:hypothetical protein ILUMI_06437 [Ignelater luminosus]|uniref:DNA polymerase delta subunit 3 n=1 Tax=Ignelater luminosus TaxID=2038154 RepID=A0A8K0DFI6_IGNLU|nr:hypothetical protein ILUMI_06437 [Ignelater luminosus]
MDSATEDVYLQKIEEFVYDEDKIVTFKWLSITLDISVHDSRRLLEKYVSDHRSQKPQELSVIHLLSGTDDNNQLVITLVNENELEDKSDALNKVLNKQIYSVQKSKQVDVDALSLVDYFDIHKPREVPIVGSIRGKNCIKRIFKQKKALPPPPPPTNKGKTSFFTKIPPKSSEKVDTKTKEDTVSVSNSLVTKEKSNLNIRQNNTAKPKQNGIANFFTKGADIKKVEERPKPEAAEKSEENESVTDKISEDSKTLKGRIQSLVDSDSDSEDIISPTPNVERQKSRRSIKRQKKDNRKDAPSPKRRKRIIQNDSDSDDIFGNDEKMDEVEENTIERSDEDSEPAFKPQLPLPPKNKKRKWVDRTYTDEEGFVITRKEFVEVSDSESETEKTKENEPVKQNLSKPEMKPQATTEHNKLNKSDNETSNDNKVVNGKTKGGAKNKKPIASNQQTLMSFFKRK